MASPSSNEERSKMRGVEIRKITEECVKHIKEMQSPKDDKQRTKEHTQSTIGLNLSSSTDLKLTWYQRKIEELKQSNMELEQKNADLNKKVTSSTEKLQGYHRKIEDLEDTIVELEQENAELKKKVEDLANKLSTNSIDKLQGSQRQIQDLQQRNAKLEEKLQQQRDIHEHRPGLLCYKMNSHPRGLCVIINNLNFHNKTDNRIGAQFDGRELENLFNELSFTVSVFNDLRRDEMPKVAANFAAKDHTQFDAFVFVVMSHGGERDVILGVDGRTTRVEDLMAEFKAPNCPTLRNKPKLFLIQTCRGSSKDESFLSTSGNLDSCMDAFSPDSTLPRSVCPQEADFLLAFATAPGYVAWRNQQSGSWFVQTLVEVIRKRHFHDHLLDMLTEVNRLVVERGQTASGNMWRVQVPAPVHTLRAKLYL